MWTIWSRFCCPSNRGAGFPMAGPQLCVLNLFPERERALLVQTQARGCLDSSWYTEQTLSLLPASCPLGQLSKPVRRLRLRTVRIQGAYADTIRGLLGKHGNKRVSSPALSPKPQCPLYWRQEARDISLPWGLQQEVGDTFSGPQNHLTRTLLPFGIRL